MVHDSHYVRRTTDWCTIASLTVLSSIGNAIIAALVTELHERVAVKAIGVSGAKGTSITLQVSVELTSVSQQVTLSITSRHVRGASTSGTCIGDSSSNIRSTANWYSFCSLTVSSTIGYAGIAALVTELLKRITIKAITAGRAKVKATWIITLQIQSEWAWIVQQVTRCLGHHCCGNRQKECRQ